jgi:zeaxanthin glucosyltransferase
LRRLLDEPSFKERLAPLAASVAKAGGTARAADIVEAVLARAHVPPPVPLPLPARAPA